MQGLAEPPRRHDPDMTRHSPAPPSRDYGPLSADPACGAPGDCGLHPDSEFVMELRDKDGPYTAPVTSIPRIRHPRPPSPGGSHRGVRAPGLYAKSD